MFQPLFDAAVLNQGTPPEVAVYTDGGCDPNPGPGGWGAIIQWGEQEWVLRGNDPDTTNNRMELHAAAAALALLEGLLGPCKVSLHTDSQYLRKGITEWLNGWVSRGWLTKGKRPVKNQDLWRLLHRLTQAHEVTWHWLQGHSGHPMNERADQLATASREELRRRPAAPDGRPPAQGSRPAVEITVKASCHSSGGPGGWGAVARAGTNVREFAGGEAVTTTNAMLIRGAAEALRSLTKPCRVTVYSDADYLIKGASQWIVGWQIRGWRTKRGEPVANREEWFALLEAQRPHEVDWQPAAGEVILADLDRAGELALQAARPAGSNVEP